MNSDFGRPGRHATRRSLTGARVAGAMTGGLIAGVALSAVMLAGEKLSGKPSELVELERKTASRLGIATRAGSRSVTLTEQAVTHGGHLAQSTLADLAYAALVDEQDDGLKAGAAFGAAFFLATYGTTGPLLGVTPPPWREQPLRAVQHPVVHTLFGLAIAHFAGRSKGGR